MAFVACDKDGAEWIFESKPYRTTRSIVSSIVDIWYGDSEMILLPKGSIRKLIGRELTFDDEPVELKGE